MATQLTPAKIPASTGPATAPATDHGPAGRVWHRIRATVEEMNYATRRLAELQTTGR
jgi:hypothetical protein